MISGRHGGMLISKACVEDAACLSIALAIRFRVVMLFSCSPLAACVDVSVCLRVIKQDLLCYGANVGPAQDTTQQPPPPMASNLPKWRYQSAKPVLNGRRSKRWSLLRANRD